MSTFFETLTVDDAYLANNNKRPRQRITRACDQCHELRTRCNGEKPCNRCNDLSVPCAYDRRPKKRGKASWRRSASPSQADARANDPELRQRQSSTTVNPLQRAELDLEAEPGSSSRSARERSNTLSGSVATPEVHQSSSYDQGDFESSGDTGVDSHELQSHESLPGLGREKFSGTHLGSHHAPMLHSTTTNPFKLPQQRSSDDLEYHSLPSPTNMGAFGAGIGSPHGSAGFENFLQGTSFPTATSFARANLPWQPVQQSPRPFNLSSDHGGLIAADMKMKYAVLSPLMPHLINVISLSLANDLLEYYFSTFTGSSTHPLSPYIQTFILRKNSVLHPSNPRRCSSALLCSMLWLAAQTSEAQALTDGPTSRVRITHKLLELTLDLLKPLRHQPENRSGQGVDTRDDETSREFLHVSPNGTVPRTIEAKNFSRSGSIDNIITYIHLGTVFSASEHKATSIRWWSVAWSMARDMKLNKEVPYPNADKNDEDLRMGNQADQHSSTSSKTEASEEEREERRRVWWLLYMCDRHLSLCYNQPLFLTDLECDTLMQPLDERIWRHARSDELEQILLNSTGRSRGPQIICYNLSLFGYFLPLMTILGAIVDLRSARSHPRFGEYARASSFWEELAADISRQLDDYHYSLQQLGGSHAMIETAEDALQQRIAVAYGTHIMHVMHILLNGKWDPINLLDDEDHWVSSASFRNATKHATSAAEVIPSIFDNDLDLSFMPWYWGIYLLQGSFLLLFVADKLQTQLAPSVLSALQSIVRAHEACAVTLDNEYQRNFRKIMISAVGQIKGRVAEDNFSLQQRRREALSLYRWNGGGGGLAL